MEPKSSDKVCYQSICPKYPECVWAKGKGCCIEYSDEEIQVVQAGKCKAEDGFPLFAGEGQVYLGLWRDERNIHLYIKTNVVVSGKVV